MNYPTELLAPAGDEECLISALDYGCDAVYLAGKTFGMRAGAKNFDFNAMERAVKLAHSRGVKVHLTCNTIPLNSEIDQFPAYIAQAQECGVDAAIACDLGVISMIKEYAPKLELHISTQTGVVNYRTAIELYRMGAKRVVLAREVGLEDIRDVIAFPKVQQREASRLPFLNFELISAKSLVFNRPLSLLKIHTLTFSVCTFLAIHF